jgi:surface protein
MFSGCEKFDCDLSKWNVSKVDDMTWAFKNCPTTPKWYDKDRWE